MVVKFDYATDRARASVKIRGVSPRIPEPKDPPRPHVVSLRFSDPEKEKLERACALYAKHWKRDRVSQAELVRAAVEMILEELEKVVDK